MSDPGPWDYAEDYISKVNEFKKKNHLPNMPEIKKPYNWESELYLDLTFEFSKNKDQQSLFYDSITGTITVDKIPVPPSPSPIRIVHWLGHTEAFICKACGKNKLISSNMDLWVVMKKSWERYDPFFQRCNDPLSTWSPKTGQLLFVNSPTSIMTWIMIRKAVFKLVHELPFASTLSIRLLQMWLKVETTCNNREQIFQSCVKDLLCEQILPTTKDSLQRLLMYSYLVI